MENSSQPRLPRVQFVVSGKFLALLLVAAGLVGGGYYWQQRLQEKQERYFPPPYFINRGAAVMRQCKNCIDAGKLKPQAEWKVGPPVEISAEGPPQWFLALEDPPMPVRYAGVLMLPVHPTARDNNPAFGFDQSRLLLVLYQNLERRPWIEQLPAPPPPEKPSPAGEPEPAAETPAETPPVETAPEQSAPAETAPEQPPPKPPQTSQTLAGMWKNQESNKRWLTRLEIRQGSELFIHAWGACHPSECDWGEAVLQRNGETLVARWVKVGYVVRTQTLFLTGDGRLSSTLNSHYLDQAGHLDQTATEYFTR